MKPVSPPAPSPAHQPQDAELERAMQMVPRGAMALAGTTVALLLVAWLAIYLLAFLPRGAVG